jgi:hypothetical protein
MPLRAIQANADSPFAIEMDRLRGSGEWTPLPALLQFGEDQLSNFA